jgi:hypothetical protein
MRIKNLFDPSHHIDGNTRLRIMDRVGLHRSDAMLRRNGPLIGS